MMSDHYDDDDRNLQLGIRYLSAWTVDFTEVDFLRCSFSMAECLRT